MSSILRELRVFLTSERSLGVPLTSDLQFDFLLAGQSRAGEGTKSDLSSSFIVSSKSRGVTACFKMWDKSFRQSLNFGFKLRARQSAVCRFSSICTCMF